LAEKRTVVDCPSLIRHATLDLALVSANTLKSVNCNVAPRRRLDVAKTDHVRTRGDA